MHKLAPEAAAIAMLRVPGTYRTKSTYICKAMRALVLTSAQAPPTHLPLRDVLPLRLIHYRTQALGKDYGCVFMDVGVAVRAMTGVRGRGRGSKLRGGDDLYYCG